jgi:hypothetical protein
MRVCVCVCARVRACVVQQLPHCVCVQASGRRVGIHALSFPGLYTLGRQGRGGAYAVLALLVAPTLTVRVPLARARRRRSTSTSSQVCA